MIDFRRLLAPRRFFCVLLAALVFVARPPAQAAEGVSGGYPQEYQNAMRSVFRAFLVRDFRKAVTLLNTADEILPPTPMSLNTRGAIAIEERLFPEGEKYCREALAKDPTFFPARFNLGEIPFLQKDYAGARKVFADLLAEKPKPDVRDLLEFRICVTYLLEGNFEAGEETMGHLKFPCETGAYYYAHAAWEFAHGNNDRASSWVRSGNWVFSAAKNSYFADVFYDIGWMDRPLTATTAKKDVAATPPSPELGTAK